MYNTIFVVEDFLSSFPALMPACTSTRSSHSCIVPELSRWPNAQFYKNKLLTSREVERRTPIPILTCRQNLYNVSDLATFQQLVVQNPRRAQKKAPCGDGNPFCAMAWANTAKLPHCGESRTATHSFVNDREAGLVVQMVKQLAVLWRLQVAAGGESGAPAAESGATTGIAAPRSGKIIAGSQVTAKTKSRTNVRQLVKKFEIGITSPYSGQVSLLRQKLEAEFGHTDILDYIKVSSIDSFQGGEVDVMVLSLVRSNVGGNIGFCGSPERINVALTRARLANFVVGDADTLCGSSELFKSYFDFVREHGCVFDFRRHLHLKGRKNEPIRCGLRAVERKLASGRDVDHRAAPQVGGVDDQQRDVPVNNNLENVGGDQQRDEDDISDSEPDDDIPYRNAGDHQQIIRQDVAQGLAALRPWLDVQHEEHHAIFRSVFSEKVLRFFGNRSVAEKTWCALKLSFLLAGIGMKVHELKKLKQVTDLDRPLLAEKAAELLEIPVPTGEDGFAGALRQPVYVLWHMDVDRVGGGGSGREKLHWYKDSDISRIYFMDGERCCFSRHSSFDLGPTVR